MQTGALNASLPCAAVASITPSSAAQYAASCERSSSGSSGTAAAASTTGRLLLSKPPPHPPSSTSTTLHPPPTATPPQLVITSSSAAQSAANCKRSRSGSSGTAAMAAATAEQQQESLDVAAGGGGWRADHSLDGNLSRAAAVHVPSSNKAQFIALRVASAAALRQRPWQRRRQSNGRAVLPSPQKGGGSALLNRLTRIWTAQLLTRPAPT